MTKGGIQLDPLLMRKKNICKSETSETKTSIFNKVLKNRVKLVRKLAIKIEQINSNLVSRWTSSRINKEILECTINLFKKLDRIRGPLFCS